MNPDKEDNNVTRQEAAKRLASLGGKAPDMQPVSRRREEQVYRNGVTLCR